MMDNILVVYYSYTGTCRLLAELMCAQLGWPRGQIVETRSRAGVIGTLRCALDALLHRRPLIRYEGPDPRDSECVVLVSPVWIHGLASPMRSFVAERRAELARVAVVCVMGRQGTCNAAREVERLLGHAPLLATSFTAREVDDGSCATPLQAFARALEQASRADAGSAGERWSPRPV